MPLKDHPTLLKAVSSIRDAHLLVAGTHLDEQYSNELSAQVVHLGIAERVHFLGGVQDVPSLLSEADIFVLPTTGKGEGCPVALLEAMASGRACVATDIPGSRDLIIHRESGLLVPPEDPAALALAIQELADNPDFRSRLGGAARQRIEAGFTIDHEVEKHIRVYLELVG